MVPPFGYFVRPQVDPYGFNVRDHACLPQQEWFVCSPGGGDIIVTEIIAL